MNVYVLVRHDRCMCGGSEPDVRAVVAGREQAEAWVAEEREREFIEVELDAPEQWHDSISARYLNRP